MAYLDYAATTPVRSEVVTLITEALQSEFGNPSSLYQQGKKAKRLLDQARQQVAEVLHVSASSVYFTSGATEANNWAIRSQAYQARATTSRNHIVCTAIEHPSVMEVCHALEKEGFDVSYVLPSPSGAITVEQFVAHTTEQTSGWIAMAVNNEVGSLLPIEALGEAAKAHDLWFHVDAVQAIGKLSFVPNCTSFSSSGHKLYAPKGIGVLVYQPWNNLPLQPLLHGGGQEKGKRSGTENVPYIIGYAHALKLAREEQQALQQHFAELSEYLYAQLTQHHIAYERNGHTQVPYIHSLWLKNHLASQILIQMDLANIAISAGSACSAGSVQPSKILQAYYPEEPTRWQESVRISFGKQTTTADIDAFITQIKQLNERKSTLWHSQSKQN